MFNLKHLKNKKIIFIISLFFITTVFLLIPQQAKAGVADAVANILGFIILPIISLIGKLAGVMIRLLINIAQYNDFINSPAVSKGWIIIRDIFNIFFVVILLVIAFATVLKIERYSYKRMLGGFLFAAVLVNFSKLICGIIIDVSQVLMLTFVNAFKSVGEGNLAEMLGLRQLLSFSRDSNAVEIGNQKLGALLLGLVFAIIALVVITIMTLIFAFRIVMLWFLVLLSPLAFVAQVLPNLQRYASQWWQKFGNQVVVGPVLAFFLWLSLAMVQEGQILNLNLEEEKSPGIEGAEQIMASPGEAGQPQFILNFIIGIAMLIGSLMVAQQMGVAGGQMAGQAAGKIQGVIKGAAKMPFKTLGKGTKALGSRGVKELESRTHVPLTKSRWQEIMSKRKTKVQGKIDDRWRTQSKTRGLASLPTGTDAWVEALSFKGGPKAIGNVFKGVMGKDKKLRKDADDLKDNKISKIDNELGAKTLDTKQKEIKGKLKETKKKEKETKEKEQTIKEKEKRASQGQIEIKDVPDFLKHLEIKINQLKGSENESDQKELEGLETLTQGLNKAKNLAEFQGEDTVSFKDIYGPQDINNKRLASESKEWVKKEESQVNQGKIQVNQEKNELQDQLKEINFNKKDQKEVQESFENLEGEIKNLDIDNNVKESLKKEIQDLIKGINVPFGDLKQEDRDKLADQSWGLRKKIKNLVDDGEIDQKEGGGIIKTIESSRGQVMKGVINSEDLKEKQKDKKELENEARALYEQAEIIRPTIITPGEREAKHRKEVEAMKNIDPETSTDELLEIYHRAEEKGNQAQAKAVIRMLNRNGNIAKVLEDFNLEESSTGLGELGEKLSNKLKISEQEAYLFINDLQTENKIKGRWRYGAGVKRDKITGTYQPTTEEDQEKIISVLSKKRNRNKFAETGNSQDLFQMQKDAKTGETVPVKGKDKDGNIIKGADSIALRVIKDDLQIFWKKIQEGKISLDIEKGLSHQSVIEDLKKELTKVPSGSAEHTYFTEIIQHLEKVNSNHW